MKGTNISSPTLTRRLCRDSMCTDSSRRAMNGLHGRRDMPLTLGLFRSSHSILNFLMETELLLHATLPLPPAFVLRNHRTGADGSMCRSSCRTSRSLPLSTRRQSQESWAPMLQRNSLHSCKTKSFLLPLKHFLIFPAARIHLLHIQLLILRGSMKRFSSVLKRAHTKVLHKQQRKILQRTFHTSRKITSGRRWHTSARSLKVKHTRRQTNSL